MGRTLTKEAVLKLLLALALGLAGVASPRLVGVAYAQVTTTTVADTVYHADGSAAAGTLIISWPTFTTMSGEVIQGGNQPVTLGTGGALSVSLVPNVGSTPIGSYYTVVYHLDDGSVQREYWVVPVTSSPVTVAAVKNTVLPTSVAMQTVSKSYVDAAIATALAGHAEDSSPYVVKTGDTMTGPLVLPADPVSANQASDKHYVDASVASVSGGIAQKVALNPTATQVVTQPTGTDLEVSRLNGDELSPQYASVPNQDGIRNALSSTDCTGAEAAGLGCVVVAPASVNGTEQYGPGNMPNASHVVDQRLGMQRDVYLNPRNLFQPQNQTGSEIDVTSSESTQTLAQTLNVQDVQSSGLLITHNGLAGGSNLFPENIEFPPYFKTTYTALGITGNYNTLGQHDMVVANNFCYGVGDCLIGSQFIHSMGGFRDSADEGAHPGDLQVMEDGRVFAGTCTTGCTTGSTSVMVTSTVGSASGTQGEGRFLIDKNPAGLITAGYIAGGSTGTIHPTATFSGSSFGVSTFFQSAASIPSQTHNIAPGTVTFAIATTGVPSGFSTNTAAAPSSSGVACLSDEATLVTDYEMANYTVVDGTHLQMTLAKAHTANATIAMGGLCGYGLEQTVDTANGMRQVFPVIGSYSATGLYYAGSQTPIVGLANQTTAYTNQNFTILSAVRNANVVTLTVSGGFGQDVNGLTMTVAGVTDSSYNGSFAVTTTSSTTMTYAQTGANSTSSGGSVSLVTGGYVLYPIAEVTSVFNPATKAVDGLFTLAPNKVAWAVNDAVEQPHYFQQLVQGDTTYVNQTTPRPSLLIAPGFEYDSVNSVGLRGFRIANATPPSAYFGNGGTHGYPSDAYLAQGIWGRTFEGQAGETAAFALHCNSKGCNRWNSAYDLFELDSSAGVDTMNYQPQTSTLTMALRGTGYSFSPTGFTAGTANVTTANTTTVNASTVNATAVNATTITAATINGTATSAVKVNGGVVPTSGDLLLTSTAGTLNSLRRIAHLFCIGDSYVQGTGAINQTTDSACGLLARDTPAGFENRGVQGTTVPQIADSAFLFTYQDNLYPSVFLNDGGLNDGTNDTCGGGAGTNCVKNYQQTLQALLAWESIPNAYRIRASAATITGSASGDTTVPLYVSASLASPGSAMRMTTSGATMTFNIPSSASTKVGLTYAATNTGTGTFGVTVDGVAQTDVCSGTTTFTASGCNGQALALTTLSPFRQEFAVTAGTTHTLVVTATNTGGVPVIAADWIPPATVTNTNAVFLMGTPNVSYFPYNATYNTAGQAVAAQMAADGLPVFFVDLRGGTPGMNNTTDISTTATTLCAAAQSSSHPNSGSGCGYDHIAQTIYNTELANNWQFSTYNGGGETVERTGFVGTTLAVIPANSTLIANQNTYGPPGRYNQMGGVWAAGSIPAGECDYAAQSSYFCRGIATDGSTGLPWSGKYVNETFAPSFAWVTAVMQDGNNLTSAAHKTTEWGVDLSTGNTYQLGTVSGRQFIATGTAPAVVAGTAAGTSGTVSVSGTNMAGVVTVVAGTSPAASAVLGTVTFSGTVASAPKGCSLFAQNAASAGVVLYLAGAPSVTGWVLDVGTVGLTAGTTYAWSYSCF